MAELRSSDLAAVREQLGREPISDLSVVARCSPGHPLVIRNGPIDQEGNPFPTLFWLTCPEAVKVVSRLEADGWIKRFAERAAEDRAFGEQLERAHLVHDEERARLHPQARGWGGVAGSPGGVKCLHAHYANHLAGGEDPVGSWVAKQVEPLHGEKTERIATVDMGTNSIRLLVAELRGGDLVEIARDMVITRLGKGVDRSKGFDGAALTETLRVLGWYSRRARALGAERIRVGATSAVRDVSDRAALTSEVRALTDAEPEILDGEREAALSFLGATARLEAERPIAIFDIGGGSTEFAMGAASPERMVSVDIGSVRLTERVGPSDPPTLPDLSRMHEEAGAAVHGAMASVPLAEATTVVGLAGTTTTIQAIALGLPRYDPDRIHRSFLSLADAQRVVEDLASMTTAQRAALPVMVQGREDVIVAGGVILLEILRAARVDGCVVSEADILEGLALEMTRSR